MCLLSSCYLEWLCKGCCCKYSITGKGTKDHISLWFLSDDDLISDNPGAPVPSVLRQVEHTTCLSFRMGCMSWYFFCSTVDSPCTPLLDYSEAQKRCPKVSQM